MFLKYILSIILGDLFLCWLVEGRGMLILHRPKDISADCAFSHKLRFDLSYGMGMSDTITLILRTISNIDYECQIDIVTERYETTGVILIIVIRFPNELSINCRWNPSAFIILRKDECYMLCSTITNDIYSKYYTMISATRFRFHFSSNSSINEDMDANLYEVTATAARPKGKNETCYKRNETVCSLDEQDYCFTSGVVCDGIKNCGTDDWYDERRSDCLNAKDDMELGSLLAMVSLICCLLLAGSHLLRKCLPAVSTSFFIFNSDEDNRICIDPLLTPEQGLLFEYSSYKLKKTSLVPIFLTESPEDEGDAPLPIPPGLKNVDSAATDTKFTDEVKEKSLATRRSVSVRIQQRLSKLTGRGLLSRSLPSNGRPAITTPHYPVLLSDSRNDSEDRQENRDRQLSSAV